MYRSLCLLCIIEPQWGYIKIINIEAKGYSNRVRGKFWSMYVVYADNKLISSNVEKSNPLVANDLSCQALVHSNIVVSFLHSLADSTC